MVGVDCTWSNLARPRLGEMVGPPEQAETTPGRLLCDDASQQHAVEDLPTQLEWASMGETQDRVGVGTNGRRRWVGRLGRHKRRHHGQQRPSAPQGARRSACRPEAEGAADGRHDIDLFHLGEPKSRSAHGGGLAEYYLWEGVEGVERALDLEFEGLRRPGGRSSPGWCPTTGGTPSRSPRLTARECSFCRHFL